MNLKSNLVSTAIFFGVVSVGTLGLFAEAPRVGVITTTADGHLRYEGGIGFREPFVLAGVLWEHEGPNILELNSGGGSTFSAILMRWALAPLRHLETRISSGDACRSACTAIFAAGDSRSAAPDGVLGFHDLRHPDGEEGSIRQATKDLLKWLYLRCLRQADPKQTDAMEEAGVFDRLEMTDFRAEDLHPGFVTDLLPAPAN